MSLMSNSKSMNIARLMTSYNFEIKELPDNLKCAHCKLVLNDACQMMCGCTFCRKCIDDMMSSGEEFCPNVSQDCGYARLASAIPDYRANKAISLLTVKCPYHLCEHECTLVNMEQHLRECQRMNVECPFHELGCTQGRLAAEEMDRHLQLDNRKHNDILIGIVANVNREMDDSRKEFTVQKQRDEDSVRQIEILKQRDSESRRDIEMMKRELVLKDGQIRTIMDQMIHVVNENKSIKRENEELIDRVRVLSDKIERESSERRESDELDSARLIEHVDREIMSIKELMESNKDESGNDMKSVLDHIQSINQDVESIKSEICSMKPQRQSLQELVGQGEVDATCEWVIDDVWKTRYSDISGEAFSGKVHPYKFQLMQMNRGIIGDVLRIYLRCTASANDEYRVWPFTGRVVISVADKDNREACKTVSRECQIGKPNSSTGVYGCTDYFVFRYSELIEAGLDLSHGLCVLCQVVPGIAA